MKRVGGLYSYNTIIGIKSQGRGQGGFTIVELLIVVVVIAILAAITVVSYNGISTQAKNAAIIEGASNVQRILTSYIATTGSYPVTNTSAFICITSEGGCHRNTSSSLANNATLDAAMATIGTVPQSVPLASSVRGGITYHYSAARTVGGVSAPLIISYYIIGINQPCGVSRIVDNEDDVTHFSTRGFSSGNVNSSGLTQCAVSIEGPGV